jgi:ABC-type nitrate/sulfonate/bicarbonate transport system permease component
VFSPKAEDIDPIGSRRRRRRVELTLAVTIPLLLLGLWQLFSYLFSWPDPKYFPPPSQIFTAGVTMVKTGVLPDDLWVTTWRTLLGFGIGSTLGIAAGVGLSLNRTVRAALEPLVYALWVVPKLALFPMLLLIVGIGNTPIVILIAVNCFVLVLIPTLAAMLTVPFGYREVAQSFKVTRRQMLRHVTYPAALPQIFVALRLSAGAAILTVVALEFVDASSGLGYLIWDSWELFAAKQMYVGIVVVTVMGALFMVLVSVTGRRLCRWAREG